jgi:hypothetical protein
MSEPVIPPRAELTQVVLSLARHLRTQLPLVADKRFAEGAAALTRLADEHRVEVAAASVGDAEAAWLSAVLRERWAYLAEPQLEPFAVIVAPREIWIGPEPIRVPLEVAVVGVEPGWEIMWDGATATTAGHAHAVADPAAGELACRAHVRARTSAGRTILIATARISVRRAAVAVRDDLRRLVVTDQHGTPAENVSLAIGDHMYRTGPGGLVELGHAAPRGARLRVEGVPAGRIPDESGGGA